MRRALVLGSGGDAASGWEIGLAAGLKEGGIILQEADLLVGTSAGARVAIQLAGGVSLEDLFRTQIDASQHSSEEAPNMDWKRWRSEIAKFVTSGLGIRDALRGVGHLAMAQPHESGTSRREFVASELATRSWPEKTILINAVNTKTGERRVFDRTSGVDLIDAVSASGALAGVWPPVLIDGEPYMDGGFYSTENADLAAGFERVMILALRAATPPLSVVPLETAIDVLQHKGAVIEVIHPDGATESAFAAAGGPLDPAVRGPAAKAGNEQGRAMATERLIAFWNLR